LEITAGWLPAFRQPRSFRRALSQALGTLTAFGRRTLARVICSQGRQQQDWSAEYKLHARAPWKSQDLFQPILQKALPFCPGRYLVVAIDDTRLQKTGRRILSAFYQRDPRSPKFRFNLMFGLRFLQMSLLVPLHRCRKRMYYRDPAFLLTTDRQATARELLQAYFDRWQIEINHREEKDTLGIGQAQLRSPHSVPRQPAFGVAAYSALLLAALLAFGPCRGQAYQPLPKWHKKAERPSCLDLITCLRTEMIENKQLLQPLGLQLDWETLGLAAAA
jgi:hypothetical protein